MHRQVRYHSNTLHSVCALTDNSESVVKRCRYDAGACSERSRRGAATILDADGSDDSDGLSDVENPCAFTARRRDLESDLMYYRNRQYSVTLGRFISRDPAGYMDSYNLYCYVSAKPLSATDPMGDHYKRWQIVPYSGMPPDVIAYLRKEFQANDCLKQAIPGADMTVRDHLLAMLDRQEKLNAQGGVHFVLVDSGGAHGSFYKANDCAAAYQEYKERYTDCAGTVLPALKQVIMDNWRDYMEEGILFAGCTALAIWGGPIAPAGIVCDLVVAGVTGVTLGIEAGHRMAEAAPCIERANEWFRHNC
jgi:RHS repeat-associated protein